MALTITIFSAKNIRDADMVGGSDPYCVCKVVGAGRDFEVKTPVVENSSNPIWNYSFDVPEFGSGDVLLFHVYDKDVVGEGDSLGMLELRPQLWANAGHWEGHAALMAAGKSDASLHVKVETSSLSVTVVSARGLRNADFLTNGQSDPYVIVKHEGMGKANEYKTPVIDNNLNPVWNHTIKISDWEFADKLTFHCYDKDDWTPDDNLGVYEMTLLSLKQKHNFEEEVQLQSTGGGEASFLSIRICRK